MLLVPRSGFPVTEVTIFGATTDWISLSWPQKIECGRASHPTAFVRGFLRCQITAWRRNDRFGPTALPLSRATSAAFAKASCPFAISRSRTGKPAVAGGPSCSCSKSNEQGGGGGRNARATSRACARFLECPPAIHPRESPGCRWLCRNHSASSGNFTFRCTHSPLVCCASQHKKLSPLCRSCGR
jgi:hypothetical protein